MGNSAKFMLVGILIVVLLIAIIWDRSSEATRGNEMQPLENALTNPQTSDTFQPPETADAKVNIGGDNSIKAIPDDITDPFKTKPGIPATPAPGKPVTPDPSEMLVDNQNPNSKTPGAPDTAAPATENTYTTVEGDSYWIVAQKVYGSGAKWESIHKANMSVCPDPNKMKAGMKLTIPALETKQAADSAVTKSTPDTKNTKKNTSKTTPTHPKEYTVKAGDNLSKIAARMLGSSSRADEIFELNKDKLDSKDDLKVGQILRLP